MEYLSEAPRKTDVCGEYDVIVCGGGIAGVAAALASSRCGAKTLLIEREYTLGGLATLGLVTIYLPLCDGMGNQVSYGITEELLKLSIKHGAAGRYPEKWLSKNSTREERQNSGRYEAQFDPNVFAVDCEKLLLGEGSDILYGTLVCSAPVEDGRITHVVVENKSGRKAYRTKAVVDATATPTYVRSREKTRHYIRRRTYSRLGIIRRRKEGTLCAVSDGAKFPRRTNRRTT